MGATTAYLALAIRDVDVPQNNNGLSFVLCSIRWSYSSSVFFGRVEFLYLKNFSLGSSKNLAIGNQCEMRYPIRDRVLLPETDDNPWTTCFMKRSEDRQ